MGRPKKYTKLVKMYVDQETINYLDKFPDLNQSDALRKLIDLGAEKLSLRESEIEKEVRKLSETVITLYTEIDKLKRAVVFLIEEGKKNNV